MSNFEHETPGASQSQLSEDEVPELPEVEVVRDGLARHLGGRTIASAIVGHPRAVRRHRQGDTDFGRRLAGRRVDAVNRRGKYLWMPLDSGDTLLAHLGMSGQLLVVPHGSPLERHLRVRLLLSGDSGELRFVDQRTFGGMWLAPAGDGNTGLPDPIAHVAPDPLDRAFDIEVFYSALRRRRTGIKRTLLDQSFVSGVGNIYADEALWRAGLHWARPTETLARREVRHLVTALQTVLGEATAAGGTTFDSLYVDVNGESGYFERSLDVYGRGGQPCRRCGTAVRRDTLMNRSAYTCPRCQPRPRRARW